MAIFLALCSSLLCAMNNYYMRKSIDSGGSSKGFLVTSMSFAILVAVVLGPVRTGFFAWSNLIAVAGIVTGVLLGIMMWSFGRAMEKGPPGLTVAYLNASNVVPAIFMMILFGVGFGFHYAWENAFGSLLVIMGLFWAVWKTSKGIKSQSFWLVFATIAFLSHIGFLMLIQWRALLLNPNLPASFLVPFTVDPSAAEWFMPMLYLAAAAFLVYEFKRDGHKAPKPVEMRFGLYGGICNGASTYILIRAAQVATPMQSAVLFPIFAVGIVFLCNIWGRVLYKENVHWRAMALCIIGLFVGTLDWSSILSK